MSSVTPNGPMPPRGRATGIVTPESGMPAPKRPSPRAKQQVSPMLFVRAAAGARRYMMPKDLVSPPIHPTPRAT